MSRLASHTNLLFRCEDVLKNTMIGSIEPSHQRMQVQIFFDISSILLPQKQRYCDRRMQGLYNDVQALGNGPLTTLLPSRVRRSRYNRKV